MTGALASFDLKTTRSERWKWYICVLLLFGTVVNYMDRLTTNTLAVEIQHEFKLNDEQYGNLELGFGLAFATGSLLFGAMVDRVGVFWLYPVVLVGWSMAGFLTGLSHSYNELLLLRIMLGAFEAGHFPCGLKTIQLLLEPRDRAMGNSLLQSGTALSAILAPQAIRMLLTDDPSSWRVPFMVIGAGGCVWVLFWMTSIRPADSRRAAASRAAAAAATEDPTRERRSFFEVIFTYRYLALLVLVVCINLNWHLFRVWLPKFLRESRGYERNDMLNFTTFYYIAADIGALATGWVTLRLACRGWSVYRARMSVFAFCCLLTTMTTVAAFLPQGPLLLGSLLLVACGGLGCYTAYYSMTQDLSLKHQGKVNGSLATCTWLTTAAFHPIFGRYLDQTGDYDLVIACMGWLPMVSLVAVLVLWNRGQTPVAEPARPAPIPEPSI